MECTLSEVLYLRRAVIESLDGNREAKRIENKSNTIEDAIVKLFRDYYDLDWFDFWYRHPNDRTLDSGKIILGMPSRLVMRNCKEGIDPKFKEYLKRVQERSYSPFVQYVQL